MLLFVPGRTLVFSIESFWCLQAKPSDLPPRRGRFPLSLMVDDPSKAFLDTNNCLPSKNGKWGGHLKWWGTLICFARGETALTSERPRSGVSATLPARPPGTLKQPFQMRFFSFIASVGVHATLLCKTLHKILLELVRAGCFEEAWPNRGNRAQAASASGSALQPPTCSPWTNQHFEPSWHTPGSITTKFHCIIWTRTAPLVSELVPRRAPAISQSSPSSRGEPPPQTKHLILLPRKLRINPTPSLPLENPFELPELDHFSPRGGHSGPSLAKNRKQQKAGGKAMATML